MCGRCYKQVDELGNPRFVKPFLLTDEGIALVNRAFDYIESNPEKWNQNSYGNHLTETNCFMGILCRISGLETRRYPWFEDNGNVPEDFDHYFLWKAMDLLGMDGDEHEDRAQYIAHYYEEFDPSLANNCRPVNVDEMRERVSVALNHDFTKPKTAIAEFVFGMVEVDLTDDEPTLKVGDNGPYPQPFNEI